MSKEQQRTDREIGSTLPFFGSLDLRWSANLYVSVFKQLFKVIIKSKNLVLSVALVLATSLLVAGYVGNAYAVTGDGPPREVKLKFEGGWSAAPECPVEYTVRLQPYGFQGAVNLTFANLPRGSTVYFWPNSVLVPFNDLAGTVVPMLVYVSPDTPNGTYRIDVIATLLPGPGSIYDENRTQFDGYFNLVVGECGKPLPDATTTTMSSATSSTKISTTTVTETITRLSSQPVTDPSTLAWAIGATAATIVLAVFLLLQRKSKS
jgi:hypothetical protein